MPRKKHPTTQVEQLLLTIPQVAQTLSIGRTKVYDLINHEGLPTVKFGAAIRIPASSLKSWVERREQ
jgi:excisionase family DNA binding protein